ncbi:aldehyde dehydrogenase family protein [Nocardioides piscis]|uniref:aldehyde dehydrogenase family protein n=1 Tax=Nocardioides piscis TaxID=2714938 RepID=UPI002483D612|nr:aldehyde dehydrogenase family protein [Nocardioides piscis]
MARIDVKKTYKLYIGGDFPRSESGRTFVVNDAAGNLLANAAQASRKDARDAVVAARKAFGPWSARTAYNRGQVVYRIAEVLEGRRDQFVAELRASEGITAAKANAYVDAAIDRLVWYAGWADKITQVVGSANPVAGPFFNISSPEPTGVVAVVAPRVRCWRW